MRKLEGGYDPLNDLEGLVLHLVLPYADNFPASTFELERVPAIPKPIAIDLRLPEWRDLMTPAGKSIAMPEVTIDEHNHPLPRKNDIRTTRKRCHMLPKA